MWFSHALEPSLKSQRDVTFLFSNGIMLFRSFDPKYTKDFFL